MKRRLLHLRLLLTRQTQRHNPHSAMHYDVIIIGAGLSGLGAGVRLAHFGKRVRIFESHIQPGGLNSYYRRGSDFIDVGLHAMTNIAPEGDRSAPLNKLLRQLRIKRGELELAPQNYSLIDFPGAKLRFSNDFSLLCSDIAAVFPDEQENFATLVQKIRQFDSMSLTVEKLSARQELGKIIKSPLLKEMLFCPLMFYGNAMQNEMDFAQFCIMFQSLLLEGMARPRLGMKRMLELILSRYQEAGGELSLGNAILSIQSKGNGDGITVLDSKGETHTADALISSAGIIETGKLCKTPICKENIQPGEMGFIEAIFKLDTLPSKLGIEPSITFRSTKKQFFFAKPEGPFNTDSHVLCAPGNFAGCEETPAATSLRVTYPASPEWWFAQGKQQYTEAKQMAFESARKCILSAWPQADGHISQFELFTPCTVKRFTGHHNGAIYGSPTKIRDGRTNMNGLFLCGTDQGFLGIVGATMSGVIIANQLLKK